MSWDPGVTQKEEIDITILAKPQALNPLRAYGRHLEDPVCPAQRDRDSGRHSPCSG